MSMFGDTKNDFVVAGELTEKRLLTSPKSDWKGYVLKIAVKGATLEIHVSEEEYNRAVEQSHYHITGDIGTQGTRTQLTAKQIKRLSEKAA